MNFVRSHILVCTGTGCSSSNSPKIIEAFERELKAQGMEQEARVVKTGCFGLCAMGPVVLVYPEGAFYTHVTPDDAAEIVSEHIVKGRIVQRLLHKEGDAAEKVTSLSETKFYKNQFRIALRNCGVINPENIDEYIGTGGYEALGRALTQQTPQQVIDAILASGLRGRGGAGFPTGRKWQMTHDAVSPDGVKFVCCNADEGDPGAFMDRAVIESDPHTLIEGMLIGAYAIGASDMYVYIRAEYPLAVERLSQAIEQARSRGLLGKNILGTDFSCDLNIKIGAGAFVCGEETALSESMEGKRGMPRLKPPFPAQSGYLNEPSNINNVETFANVAWIIQHGGTAFAAMGTENSKGTKVRHWSWLVWIGRWKAATSDRKSVV